MKLTIEHLAPYLPYDLLLWYPEKLPFSEWFDAKKEAHSLKMGVVGMMSCIKGNSKPILRPLSDLTKEIEVDGEKFIFTEWIIENSSIGYDPIKDLIKPLKKDIRWINHCEYYIVQYLLQFHFDIFGLISNNLAIDINTL